MNTENKVISIAVGDRLQIEGVGTVELVVVAPEKTEQSKQHPLVGKWVRCVGDIPLLKLFVNKWYPITGLDEVGGLVIPSGTRTDKHGYSQDTISGFFDLSNPCDFDPNMPEAVNPKFKVGDEVVVVDNYHNYGALKKAFYYLGLKGKMENKPFKHQSKAIVFGVCRHEYGYENLYALRDSEGNECVIGEEGIKLAGINKQEWLDAASKLFDSWMKISGGYVPKIGVRAYFVEYDRSQRKFYRSWDFVTMDSFSFENKPQAEQFLSENEKDLKTFFHQA
jgi:hypothetical protein